MRIPLDDAAVSRAPLDEALVVAVVTAALATAVTRYILQYLRMAGGELVHGLNHVDRPGKVLLKRYRRQRSDGRLHRLNRDRHLRGLAAKLLRVYDSGYQQRTGEQGGCGQEHVPDHGVMVSCRRNLDKVKMVALRASCV